MNCQDLGPCEEDRCHCDKARTWELHKSLIDIRIQELMEAIHASQLWAGDLPTLSKLKALEIYGAMVREQITNN